MAFEWSEKRLKEKRMIHDHERLASHYFALFGHVQSRQVLNTYRIDTFCAETFYIEIGGVFN